MLEKSQAVVMDDQKPRKYSFIRTAFLLLTVKKIFRKKRKSLSYRRMEIPRGIMRKDEGRPLRKISLNRARTLPAILVSKFGNSISPEDFTLEYLPRVSFNQVASFPFYSHLPTSEMEEYLMMLPGNHPEVLHLETILIHGCRLHRVDLLASDGYEMTRTLKKKFDKLSKINIHVHAMFAAIEHGQVEKLKTILSMTDVDVNSMNREYFTPLDIAVMLGDLQMVNLLQSYGAAESSQFTSCEQRMAYLNDLCREADWEIKSMMHLLAQGDVGNRFKEISYELTAWERRWNLLKRMKSGLDHLKPPEPPTSFHVEVLKLDAVQGTFSIPINSQHSMCTKVKVQWSCSEDFSPVSGSKVILDITSNKIVISELLKGVQYYFRILGGNMKGYGKSLLSYPHSLVTSAWKENLDAEGSPRSGPRSFDVIFDRTRSIAEESALLIRELSDGAEANLLRKKASKKRNILEQLFTSLPKFVRNLNRGVYLCCVLYSTPEDRILVTNDDYLPTVEVDEVYPVSLNNDFYWFAKVACTWEDVRLLRDEICKHPESSALHFRGKLLQATLEMQSALGFDDLGHLYFMPLKNVNGTTVLSVLKAVDNPKSISSLHFTWLPYAKLKQRYANRNTEEDAASMLIKSLPKQIQYSRSGFVRLSDGLYLAYLKLKSFMDSIRVIVPDSSPNILPCIRMRENSHVSREEWKYLLNFKKECPSPTRQPSETEFYFAQQLVTAVQGLFSFLAIEDSYANMHRFYLDEVIELTPTVSLILILPPSENVCAVPGQDEQLSAREDFLNMPVQIFEIIHAVTYKTEFVQKYSRLSSTVETDMFLSNQILREAFSCEEVQNAKKKLRDLQGLQMEIEEIWRNARWIMDIISYARDKSAKECLLVETVLQKYEESKASLLGLSGVASIPDIIELTTCNVEDYKVEIPDNDARSPSTYNSTLRIPEIVLKDDVCDKPYFTQDSVNFDNAVKVSGASLRKAEERSLMHTKSENSLLVNLAVPASALRKSSVPTPKSLEEEDSDVSIEKYRSLDTITSRKQTLDDFSMPCKSWASQGVLPTFCNGSGTSVSSSHSTENEDSRGSTSSQGSKNLDTEILKHKPTPESSVVQVYAAYDTGLAPGTSVKLKINSDTLVREVINLVVKQLNLALILKGKTKPIYTSDQLQNFCLVTVIGTRERRLRDDFKLLYLQQPWKKGKLFVRMVNDILAALNQNQSVSRCDTQKPH